MILVPPLLNQAKLLKRYGKKFTCYDSDKAGINATIKR